MTIRVLSFLALLLSIAAPAPADSLLYTYTGLPYQMVTGSYMTSDYVRGWFVLDAAFVPPGFDGSGADTWNFTGGVRDWSFTDGHQTLTPATTSNPSFWLGVTLPGNIFGHPTPGETVDNSWFVELHGLDDVNSIVTELIHREAADGSRLQGIGTGTCWPNPAAYGCQTVDGRYWGTWTVVAVPEPMSLLLVLAGIGGVAVARRRWSP